MGSITNLKQTKDNISVLMVAFPLQGHLNQLLHLSRLISAYSVSVHFVGTTAHNRQAKRRFHSTYNTKNISNVIFHNFPLPPYDSPPPNPDSPIKFPSHLQPLIDASSHLRHPVSELMRKLSATSKRVVIICDSMMGSVVQDFASLPNAEMYTFRSVSAFTNFLFLSEKLGRPFTIDDEIFENFPTMENCFTPEFVTFMSKQHEYMKLSSGRIYNTCRVIESQFLDYLSREEISGNKKQWALGPFNPVKIRGLYSSCHDHKCLHWLDRQEPNSAIFVSFGTTTSLSDVQVNELPVGLEKSQQKFIWILREADRGSNSDDEVEKITDRLPNGFENKVEDRGLILRDWAPQLEILGHFAVGGFMSHCGWNSCMEGVSMGVPIAAWPIAAWPMHSDQPRNALLITEVLKIGVVVKDWGDDRDEVVESLTIERVVRRLMASREGEEIRERAAELGGRVRSAVAKGGATCMEFDDFISHITK